jgi:hypothetical protein
VAEAVRRPAHRRRRYVFFIHLTVVHVCNKRRNVPT